MKQSVKTSKRWTSLLLAVALLSTLTFTVPAPKAEAANLDLAQYVDEFGGANEEADPGAFVPFSMMKVTPMTMYRSGTASSLFSTTHTKLMGFTFVRNAFRMLPTTKSISVSPASGTRDAYNPTIDSVTNSESQPGYYKLTVNDSATLANTAFEVAADQRSAIAKVSFPAGSTPKLLLDMGHEQNSPGGSITIDTANKVVTGYAITNFGQFRMKHYYHMAFDTAFAATGTWNGDVLTSGGTSVTNNSGRVGGWVQFADGADVTVRVGVSTVSAANAKGNVDAEIPSGTSLATEKNKRLYDLEQRLEPHQSSSWWNRYGFNGVLYLFL